MVIISNQDQIDELNMRVKTRLGPSAIHGVGVFALRDILKGQKLYAEDFPRLYTLPYAQFNKLFPEVAQYLLVKFPTVAAGSKFAYPDTRIQAYMNHSTDPNYGNESDMALRDIKAGEEVTEDYRNIPGAEVIHKALLQNEESAILES